MTTTHEPPFESTAAPDTRRSGKPSDTFGAPPSRSTSRRRWLGVPLLALGLVFALVATVGCAASSDEQSANSVAPSGADGGVATGGAMGIPDYAESPSTPPMPAPGVAQREDGAFGETTPSSAGVPGGTSTSNLGNALGRSVIRNGHVELIVASVEDSFQQVRQIVDSSGGYVAASTFTGQRDSQRAYLTLRIPAEEFDSLLERLSDLAIEVQTASTSSQDVTEEYTDLQAHLRTQRAVEEQYLTLLREATQIGDILQIQERLSYTRYEIERIQGRLNLLDSLTSLATLEVTLLPESDARVEPEEPSFGDRVSDAWEDSLATIAAAGTGIILALIWGWWLLPLAIVAFIVARQGVRRWSRRVATADASRAATSSQPDPERVDTPDGAA